MGNDPTDQPQNVPTTEQIEQFVTGQTDTLNIWHTPRRPPEESDYTTRIRRNTPLYYRIEHVDPETDEVVSSVELEYVVLSELADVLSELNAPEYYDDSYADDEE